MVSEQGKHLVFTAVKHPRFWMLCYVMFLDVFGFLDVILKKTEWI